MTTLPSYRDLPKLNDLPASWGLFGSDEPDYFGCLNLLTPEKLVSAARLVTRGAVFALNWSADLPDPPMFGGSSTRTKSSTGRQGTMTCFINGTRNRRRNGMDSATSRTFRTVSTTVSR